MEGKGREMKVRWEMWGAGRGGDGRPRRGGAVGLCFLHSFIASFFPPDLSCTVLYCRFPTWPGEKYHGVVGLSIDTVCGTVVCLRIL